MQREGRIVRQAASTLQILRSVTGNVSGWPLGRFTVQSRIRALVFAADHQRLKVIDQLIAGGTPVNEADAEWGRLPLHIAAQNGRPASVRRLLAHGADPELRDPVHQRTPLEWCQPGNRYLDSPAHDQVGAILRQAARRRRAPSRIPGQEPAGIQIRIEGTSLPGRECGPSPDSPGYRNIHVGIQRRDRRDELLGLQPADAPSAARTFQATAVPAHAGIDLKGTYIQGRPGGRFIYLSWRTVDDAGTFTMFRRATLWLDAIDPVTLDAARRYGRLIGRLKLTDGKGHPLCAPFLREPTRSCRTHKTAIDSPLSQACPMPSQRSQSVTAPHKLPQSPKHGSAQIQYLRASDNR